MHGPNVFLTLALEFIILTGTVNATNLTTCNAGAGVAADTASLGHGLTGAAVRQHYLDMGFTVFMESGAY